MSANTIPATTPGPSGPPVLDPGLAARRAGARSNIEKYLTDETRGELHQCLKRLTRVLPPPDGLRQETVLLMYGGGKDSTYLVAATRYLQLEAARLNGTTFNLRIVTNRHAGMPRAVMENIERVYAALECGADPDVELLLIDGQEISPFNVKSPLPLQMRAQNREDILITGHRTRGMFRPMFCNACNLSMVNAMALGLSYDDGADVMVTGDSPRELRDYFRWTVKTARRLGVRPGAEGRTSLRSTLGMLSGISEHYFESLSGNAAGQTIPEHKVMVEGIEREPAFFSIFEDTRYEAGAHWDLLINGLHFVFDDLAFSFSESDCGNPALMAHLNGLKMERIHERDYRQGIEEYVRFAVGLMRKKNFPQQLIELVERRYDSPVGIEHMRRKMNVYAKEAFYLSESQLVCLLYSPFTDQGRFLETYLRKEQPHLIEHLSSLHRLLGSPESSELSDILTQELTNFSGLTLKQIQLLYRSQLVTAETEGTAQDPILAILEKDPHKAVVLSERGEGQYVTELLTGR